MKPTCGQCGRLLNVKIDSRSESFGGDCASCMLRCEIEVEDFDTAFKIFHSIVLRMQEDIREFKAGLPCEFPNLYTAAFGMDVKRYTSRELARFAIEASEFHGEEKFRSILQGKW